MGVVTKVERGGNYTVLLENGHEVLARACGKMTLHHIRIRESDVVDLDLSPYDLTKGRITYRRK